MGCNVREIHAPCLSIAQDLTVGFVLDHSFGLNRTYKRLYNRIVFEFQRKIFLVLTSTQTMFRRRQRPSPAPSYYWKTGQ
jgi:hypothetical protein